MCSFGIAYIVCCVLLFVVVLLLMLLFQNIRSVKRLLIDDEIRTQKRWMETICFFGLWIKFSSVQYSALFDRTTSSIMCILYAMSNELNATKKIFDSAVLITVTHDLKECKTTEPNLSTCIAMQIFRVYRKNKEKTEYIKIHWLCSKEIHHASLS